MDKLEKYKKIICVIASDSETIPESWDCISSLVQLAADKCTINFALVLVAEQYFHHS